MIRTLILLFAALAAGSALADPASVARGRKLAESACARCHAVGAAGDSPNTYAPPFRTLLVFEPGRSIEEVFSRGLLLGHTGMPQFSMSEQNYADLLAYLRSVQTKAAS
ncbi:MAG: cytochrome c [Caulobacteraceae bacterium]